MFPPATDLKQAGQDQPLAVFEHDVRDRRAARGRADGAGRRARRAAAPALSGVRREPLLRADHRRRRVDARRRAGGRSGRRRSTRSDLRHDCVRHGRSAGRAAGGRPPRRRARRRRGAASGDGIAALDGFTMLGTTGGYLGRRRVPAASSTTPRTASRSAGMFEGRGPLAILLLVLVGGLALNLTPCVLPMIPINLAIIGAGAQAGSRGRGFLLGGAYGAAMALVYGVARPGRHPHRRHVRHDQLVALVQPRHRHAVRRARRWRCSTSSRSTSRRYSSNLGMSIEPRQRSRWRSAWARSRRCSPAPASRRS